MFLFDEMDELEAKAEKPSGPVVRRALVFDCSDPCALPGSPVEVRYRCPECESETDWLAVESLGSARFGIPCPSCEL